MTTLKVRITSKGRLLAELPEVSLLRDDASSWPVLDLGMVTVALSPEMVQQLDSILADSRVRVALKLDVRPIALARMTKAQSKRGKRPALVERSV